MLRMHVHVGVKSIEESVRFYSNLFSAEPTVRKDDYAKWMLDDPRVNFAISARGGEIGIEHLGIQAETDTELREVYSRLAKADAPVLEEGATVCCYAKSEKSWVDDPQGISWETFLTSGESTVYGHERTASACCVPTEEKANAATCCGPAEKSETATSGCC
ncbi:MAG: ArsI/CadI family heavy metal resistance metalloenzyme [Myxococcota bacterium]